MRAIAVSKLGATPELVELPKPEPAPGELLVRLKAASLNPADWKFAEGILGQDMPHSFPMVLGNDGAGIVEAVGDEVTRFKTGDEVYGQFMRVAQGQGGYAEYALVAQDATVAPIPPGMSFSQAAAIPTASMTAFNLVDNAKIAAAQTVLVVGATGGVGQSVVQFAAARDAHVIATAKPEAVDTMKDLGAAMTVDPEDAVAQVKAAQPDGIDTLIMLAGDAAALNAASQLVRSAGTVVSSVFTADPQALAARGIRGANVENAPNFALLDKLNELFEARKFTVVIEQELPLEQAPEALERNRAGGARGKTVFTI